MKIKEILKERRGNFSIPGVLDIIASDRAALNKNYCHYNTGKAIKDKTVSDSDYLILLGSSKTKSVVHSIIVSGSGDILVDTFKDGLVKYDADGFEYKDSNGMLTTLDVVFSTTISNFRNKYEKHIPGQ